ncbi:MAG: LemA family protein [Candidatus Woesearchaeota archaeon]
MKTNRSLWIGIIVLVLILLWFVVAFNSLVKKEETVNGQWAQVETQYQRRIDLIPNLVEVTKGYMQFESELLENITALRSGWINANTPDEKIVAANDLDSAISRLLVVYENYPELKSVDAVRSLMDELSGTENRISVERQRYNDAVREYNIGIKTFPNVIIAGVLDYDSMPYYESLQGSEDAPKTQIY